MSGADFHSVWGFRGSLESRVRVLFVLEWCNGGTVPGFDGGEALDECHASEWGGAEVAFGEMHGVEVAL